VVATDIDTRWLEPMVTANLEVCHHDVVADPLDADGYDLVHARLVLEHLPQRGVVAAKLASAVRPGGWLVVEDYDIRTMAFTDPPLPRWVSANQAVVRALQAAGSDPLSGAELLRLLLEVGLVDVTAEGSVRPMTIPDLAPTFRPALERLVAPIVGAGSMAAADLEAVMRDFDERPSPPTVYTPILVSVAGRRPTTERG
jgi:hypothetical protein